MRWATSLLAIPSFLRSLVYPRFCVCDWIVVGRPETFHQLHHSTQPHHRPQPIPPTETNQTTTDTHARTNTNGRKQHQPFDRAFKQSLASNVAHSRSQFQLTSVCNGRNVRSIQRPISMIFIRPTHLICSSRLDCSFYSLVLLQPL